MQREAGHDSTPFCSSGAIPLLRWDLRFMGQEAPVLLLDDSEYSFGGIGWQEVRAILSQVDGRTTVASISQASALAPGRVEEFINKLLDLGLAVDVRSRPEAPLVHARFTAICRRLFPVWKERLFSHPLWVLLTSGEASPSLFLGWLLESYHFIEGVNDRLALAVAECPSVHARHLFARHFVEEYNHSEFFMKSLGAMGLSAPEVRASRPLPGTLAVLHHMRRCARRDPLEYAVCSGFLESTGEDRAKARQFFDCLVRPAPARRANVVTPLQAHLNLDEDYGHNGVIESVCIHLGEISQERASAALAAGNALVETLELWSTDILRTYQRAGSAPRTPLNAYRSPTEQPLHPSGAMIR